VPKYAGEQVLFLQAVQQYRRLHNAIYNTYIHSCSPLQVNLPFQMVSAIKKELSAPSLGLMQAEKVRVST
jgi:predicted  nucleic acid-binding Zn ribbon protein